MQIPTHAPTYMAISAIINFQYNFQIKGNYFQFAGSLFFSLQSGQVIRGVRSCCIREGQGDLGLVRFGLGDFFSTCRSIVLHGLYLLRIG